MDEVCSRPFCGRSSINRITEEDILEVLRVEAGTLDTAPLALGFKIAIKYIAHMKRLLSVVERFSEVTLGVADLMAKKRCTPAGLRRFDFVPRYGCLVVEAALEGI